MLDGSRIVEQDVHSTENYRLRFTYDANGSPLYFDYIAGSSNTGTRYYYITNLQGDVVKIVNQNNAIVAEYLYDAWGKVLSVTETSGTSIGAINPIRYRGYFYDNETGLYYCNSRYYDPEIRRFINADALVSTGQGFAGLNMFAYCGNNPVMRIDVGGCFWDVVFDIFSLGCSVVDVVQNPDDPLAWAGLAGDALDVALPFVGGVGETVKIANATNDIIDSVDDAVDTVRTIENTTDAVVDSYKVQETFMPDDFYIGRESSRYGPPYSSYECYKYNTYTNKYEKSVTYYDYAGRQSIRIDYSTHGRPYHVSPHVHMYKYDKAHMDGYEIGKEIR